MQPVGEHIIEATFVRLQKAKKNLVTMSKFSQKLYQTSIFTSEQLSKLEADLKAFI